MADNTDSREKPDVSLHDFEPQFKNDECACMFKKYCFVKQRPGEILMHAQ